jgi:GTP-binding protein EngB required for normal cell division
MSGLGLLSEDHRDLLDVIDELRSQGINRLVDLPEIIVCGDQSAGKSSVLEAISQRPFPTKDGLCTRFATELILRRDTEEHVAVSIIPGPGRLPDEKARLKEWRPSFPIADDGLGLIIEEAKQKMGLQDSKAFGNDSLRIVISGPKQPHLTLVDLPGLFKAENKEQSTIDAEIVRSLVIEYMKKERSIILAVVSAQNQYVLQEVMTLAREVDPEGLRTIGLITKPDKLDPGSETQQGFVDLALNKDVELKLGWHVLKNRSYEQRHFTSAERDEAEKLFFQQGIWASLASTRCGVGSLRPRLSHVLKDRIVEQLPMLVEDIESKTKETSQNLKRLGGPRTTYEQQLRFMTNLSQSFTNLMTATVQGNYNDLFFGNTSDFASYEKRLRAVIQTRLVSFRDDIYKNGETRVIVESEDDCYGPREVTRVAYVEEVRTRIARNRGRELLGLFSPLIVSDLFSEQCRPWRGIVQNLLKYILHDVRRVIDLIVKEICPPEAEDRLLKFVGQQVLQLETSMNLKVEEMLKPHLHLHAITYNPQLTHNVQKAQRARNKSSIREKLKDTFGMQRWDNDPERKISINPSRIVDLFLNETEPDMEKFGSSIAVDYMQAYYKIALDRFIDGVCVMAVEECLIDKLPSLLEPTKIIDLGSDEISRIIRDSDESIKERDFLVERLETLSKARRDINRWNRAKTSRGIYELQQNSISIPSEKSQDYSRRITPDVDSTSVEERVLEAPAFEEPVPLAFNEVSPSDAPPAADEPTAADEPYLVDWLSRQRRQY